MMSVPKVKGGDYADGLESEDEARRIWIFFHVLDVDSPRCNMSAGCRVQFRPNI